MGTLDRNGSTNNYENSVTRDFKLYLFSEETRN